MAAGKRILYFIKGTNPTEEERQAALKVGTLMFRSLESYSDVDFIEDCDGVAGAAPDRYLEKYGKEGAAEETPKDPPPPPPPPPAAPPPPPPTMPNPFAKQ